MASSGKKKTTMAKLTRESRLRERRLDKKARKDARKLAASQGPVVDGETLEDGEMLEGGEMPDDGETPGEAPSVPPDSAVAQVS
jgi:hypothetical protein